MVEDPDSHRSPNDQSDVDRFTALADGPVTALGLSSSAADALAQALEVKTVRDLADNRFVRRAQAIAHLANEQQNR
jgi:pantoate kinase